MNKIEALNAVEKAIDIAYEKGRKLVVNDLFSFADYLSKNFDFSDNTSIGNVYKNVNGVIYSEQDIYDEWLNNKKHYDKN